MQIYVLVAAVNGFEPSQQKLLDLMYRELSHRSSLPVSFRFITARRS